MALRVTLAGRVGIEVDGGEVTAVGLGRPGRLALAYLACERHRAVPRDELADVLWGGERPQSWDQMLRGLALKLRGVLSAAGLDPTEALSTAAGAFRLHLPPDAVVDVEEAASALASADASLAAGYPGLARAQASGALAVASRQFAPTLTGGWVERRQAELADFHLRALEALARAALAEGDWAGAIANSEEAIAREPFRESAYLVLMDAHAGAGNRGEALRAYSRCREVLVEELGVDPSPPTEAAYLRLLGDEPAPIEATSAALPLPAALAPVPGAFLVGRAAEVEALEAAFKRAGVDGRQGVLVGGEPGAGKTTLVATAARAAHAGGARVLYGRCDEELPIAYQPFAQALSHYVATAPTAELKAHVAAQGANLSRLVPELARRLPEAIPPPATDAESDRRALFEAVTDGLARAAKDTIVVLVLDDLHWAGAGTLALLRHLLADPSRAALLVLATYRHTDTPSGSPLATTLADLRRAPGVERIALEGLDADGVAAFVEAAGKTDDDDGALARALHAHTAGNPFFVGELLRHLTETGATYRRQAPWSYYADAHGLAVPEAAVEVVGRRLGRLSPDANRALVLAAVNGAEFDLAVLEATEADQPDTVLDGLEEAQAASLIVELDRPGHYRFAHALVRDAIYGRLSGARRARLHRQVGEALESLPGGPATRLPALAHHFAEAAAAGGAGKAADYALAAADQAMAQGGAEDAVAALERGLEALDLQAPADLERKALLFIALARIHLFLDDAPARWRAAAMATELAREVGSGELLARAVIAYVPEVKDAVFVSLLEEALAALDDRVPELRAMLLSQLAISEVRTFEECDGLTQEALALARRSGDQVALGVVLRGRFLVLMGSPRATELLETAEELVRAAPTGAWQGWRHGHRFRAIARLVNADRAGFDADVDELERRGQRRVHWMEGLLAARFRVTQALLDGRFNEVEDLALRAREMDDDRAGPLIYTVELARLRWEQGRMPEMEALVRPVVEGPGRPSPQLRAMLAIAELGQALDETPRQQLRHLGGLLDQVSRRWHLHLLAGLAELSAVLADTATAAGLYDRFTGHAGQVVASSNMPGCPGSVDRYLGMLATVLGRWTAADAHFKAALRIEGALCSPPFLARTRYWYAHLLVTRPEGNRDEAGELAALSRASAGQLGMELLAEQAGKLLDQR